MGPKRFAGYKRIPSNSTDREFKNQIKQTIDLTIQQIQNPESENGNHRRENPESGRDGRKKNREKKAGKGEEREMGFTCSARKWNREEPTKLA